MGESETHGGKGENPRFRPHSRAHQLPQTVEQEASPYGFFAKARANHNGEDHGGEGRRVSDEIRVDIGSVDSEDRKHCSQENTKRDPDGDAKHHGANPASWPNEPELPPRRPRRCRPDQGERGADEVASQNDGNGAEDPNRPPSGKLRAKALGRSSRKRHGRAVCWEATACHLPSRLIKARR